MTREDRAERRHAKRVANYKALQREKERKDARGPVIAKFAPGLTSIKLYANGDLVSSMHGSGSAIGATATVDQSGSKRLVRDTRQSYLTIEGPRVSIAAKLGSNSGLVVKAARMFAAEVNRFSQSHAPQAAVPKATGDKAGEDRIARLERLVKLRDSGALTDEEFAAEKAKIL
jgi:Short C-terminal domain